MSAPTLEQDVARGREIVRLMAALKSELKEIQERMEARALKGPHVPLADATREGRQYLAQGPGVVVPVVITADSLIQSFADGSATHQTLADAAHGRLGELFERCITWETKAKDGQKFRELATEVLREAAPAFITACLIRDKHKLPKNKIVIAWDRAQEVGK